MATLTCGSLSYTVDHAVKGADYIHGYDAEGNLVVAFEGVVDFSIVSYDETYMTPGECLEESCNVVKYVNGKLVDSNGNDVDIATIVLMALPAWEGGSY